MKVLIADDDLLIRKMLGDLLAEMGHTALVAASGAEAVALAAKEKPDVLILDFLMPRQSGLEALRAIRATGICAPAILLSAIRDGSLTGIEGMQAVDWVLEKPVTRHTLEKAFAKVLGA